MAKRTTKQASLDAVVTLQTLTARLDQHFLTILGGFHPKADDTLPPHTGTLLLLGPKEPGFWDHLRSQPEWGAKDPVDSWSRRVIGNIACDIGAKALFPFGGAPYHPFFSWALQTGQVWQSPARLLVHADQGLFVSFRGALALRETLPLPPARARPCDSCDAPCLSACPAGALGPDGYDVPGCHRFLDQNPQGGCLTAGCLVRRACPAGKAYARLPEQSAYHMSRFHKAGT